MKQPPGGMTSCVPMVRLLGACRRSHDRKLNQYKNGNQKEWCGADDMHPQLPGVCSRCLGCW